MVIGGGPTSLGLLVNAIKTNRLNEVLQGDGIAIIESGLSFGGGLLGKYGINSNTSGVGFLKCTYKKTNKQAKDRKGSSNEAAESGANTGKSAKGPQKKQS